MKLSGFHDKRMSTNTVDWFFANTRGNVDQSHIADQNFANDAALGRQTSLFGDCSGTLSPASAMADQPGMIARGGYGMGAPCEIDTNSDLRWGDSEGLRVKGPKQLWIRPFSTTPNLGRGREAGSVEDESSLIHAQLQRAKKEASTIMDKTIPNYYQPLIPVKQSEYSNPNNWVQNWTWGGDSSRLVKKTRVEGST
jgi:hypothetical protein